MLIDIVIKSPGDLTVLVDAIFIHAQKTSLALWDPGWECWVIFLAKDEVFHVFA